MVGYGGVRGACLDIYIRGYVKKNGRFLWLFELFTIGVKVGV